MKCCAWGEVRSTCTSLTASHATATHTLKPISKQTWQEREYLNHEHQEHDCKHEIAWKKPERWRRRHRTIPILPDDSMKELYLKLSLMRNLSHFNSIFAINFHRLSSLPHADALCLFGRSWNHWNWQANNHINVSEKQDSKGMIRFRTGQEQEDIRFSVGWMEIE